MFFIKYYKFLKENSSFSLFKLMAMGLIAGVSGTALLIIINNVIALDPQNEKFCPNLFIGFIAIMGVHFTVQTFYQASLIRLSMDLIWKVRMKALSNIRHADLLKYEAFGISRIYNILTSDVASISRVGQMLSAIIVAAVTILSCLIYLAWLTPIGCLISIAVMVFIAIVHAIGEKKNNKRFRESVEVEDKFFRYFSYILYGLKELKLDKHKNDDLFHNHVEKAAMEAKELRTRVNIKFLRNSLLGQFFFFGVIALFLFVFPFFKISLLSNSAQYILITLYIMSPAQTIAQFIPDFFQASIGLDRFRELEKLEQAKGNDDGKNILFSATTLSLSFKEVVFKYEAQHGEKGFELGPLNFNFCKGELVFLTGGNGSGKSTFIRLLTGLYAPGSGSIIVDGNEISTEHGESYRSLFSVVYTDSFLFDKVFGMKENQDQQMNKILKDIGLGSKVKFKDHAFSTTDLSYGQKKRLSLATCLLEDNEIYIFDELAANQDPEFKDYFYHQVLSDLRNKGKIVLVVTHDEKYFYLADKHYKMEMGKIVKYEEYAKV